MYVDDYHDGVSIAMLFSRNLGLWLVIDPAKPLLVSLRSRSNVSKQEFTAGCHGVITIAV